MLLLIAFQFFRGPSRAEIEKAIERDVALQSGGRCVADSLQILSKGKYSNSNSYWVQVSYQSNCVSYKEEKPSIVKYMIKDGGKDGWIADRIL